MQTPPLPFPWADNEATHKRRTRHHKIELAVLVALCVAIISAVAYRAWMHWGQIIY